MDVRVARIFNTYGPKMHMYDGKMMMPFSYISPGTDFIGFKLQYAMHARQWMITY